MKEGDKVQIGYISFPGDPKKPISWERRGRVVFLSYPFIMIESSQLRREGGEWKESFGTINYNMGAYTCSHVKEGHS